MEACTHNKVGTAILLLERGSDCNLRTRVRNRVTVLVHIVMEMSVFLMVLWVSVQYGETAFLLASQNKSIMKCLLAKGANHNEADIVSRSSIDILC